jgi:hypothetical protein
MRMGGGRFRHQTALHPITIALQKHVIQLVPFELALALEKETSRFEVTHGPTPIIGKTITHK